jgi:hypothetical protein
MEDCTFQMLQKTPLRMHSLRSKDLKALAPVGLHSETVQQRPPQRAPADESLHPEKQSSANASSGKKQSMHKLKLLQVQDKSQSQIVLQRRVVIMCTICVGSTSRGV